MYSGLMLSWGSSDRHHNLGVYWGSTAAVWFWRSSQRAQDTNMIQKLVLVCLLMLKELVQAVGLENALGLIGEEHGVTVKGDAQLSLRHCCHLLRGEHGGCSYTWTCNRESDTNSASEPAPWPLPLGPPSSRASRTLTGSADRYRFVW